ncbi:MAG: hypothetical protein IJT18_05550 [Oscillospiraceae bacterium]|nr:hypothetical protein [Oscillospiraceae bacterium]
MLKRLAVSRFALRVTYAMTAVGNALLPHKKRRTANAAAFIGAPDGLILGQTALRELPYGKCTMDYNGCEVIACHNALRLLGRPKPLGETAAYFERHGLFRAGKWGTHVSAIPRFFERQGFAVRTFYADECGDFAGRIAVFSFWNSARRLRSGVHTVALERTADGLRVYNLHGTDTAPCTQYRTFAEFLAQTDILPIQLVVLT